MNTTILTNPIGTANSRNFSCGLASKTPPDKRSSQKGQSLRNIPTSSYFPSQNDTLLANELRWYVVRATRGRAQAVFDKIMSFNDNSLEPYLPVVKRHEYSNDDFDNPSDKIVCDPLDANLLFLRSTLADFRRIINLTPAIPGLAPYYNKVATNIFGKNDFLVVPDRQMESFKIIVESGNEDILIHQNNVPNYVVGDTVVVIGGPFAGVEGVVMKYRHQKRVFVELKGVGCFGTAYVPGTWIRRVE